MMEWIFAGITLSAVLMATFVSHTRHAILALWVAGLGIGALYLTVGAEFLAIVQWIVSTLVTISFVFFAVMFGEFNHPRSQSSPKKGRFLVFLSILLGAAFAGVIGLGSRELPVSKLAQENFSGDLSNVGRALTQENLLSLEVLALILFLVLVGGGVIARSEGGPQE